MQDPSRHDSTFRVTHEHEPSDVLLCGLSNFGLAGLTAVDYLVDHLDLEVTGHVRAEGLPSITPFEEGRPRYPVRLYSRSDLDVTVLVSELYVPPPLGENFSEAVLEWTADEGVEEVAILAGIPIPHGPEGHRTFYVATDDYRSRRLVDDGVPPMGSGFLDGVNAALVERGMSSSLCVAVYVTPVHAQAPDVEAAIRLVDAVERVYELGLDSAPLQEFAAEVQQYYEDLADRLEERSGEQHEDRMYM